METYNTLIIGTDIVNSFFSLIGDLATGCQGGERLQSAVQQAMGVEQAARTSASPRQFPEPEIGLAINNLVQLFLNPPGAAPPAGASSGQQLGYFTNLPTK